VLATMLGGIAQRLISIESISGLINCRDLRTRLYLTIVEQMGRAPQAGRLNIMRMIAAHGGQIQILNSMDVSAKASSFITNLDAVDDVAGREAFAGGAVGGFVLGRGKEASMFFVSVM